MHFCHLLSTLLNLYCLNSLHVNMPSRARCPCTSGSPPFVFDLCLPRVVLNCTVEMKKLLCQKRGC